MTTHTMKLHPTGHEDWCHVCGNREPLLVDIWTTENAEHSLINSSGVANKYIRICTECVHQMQEVING